MDTHGLLRIVRLFCALLLAATLGACSSAAPRRPLVNVADVGAGCLSNAAPGHPDQTTPEIGPGQSYTLHYLEFDDQGWLYPDQEVAGTRRTPSRQIDCAIADLTHKLNQGDDIRAFVFVHGWHHTADDNDRDLRRFRALLAEESKARDRKVVGFYIGWNGESVRARYVNDLTFWSRKNAALHVAEGSVREFFARMKALRDGWNRPKYDRSMNCGKVEALTEGHLCPLRTVMIGHSFGAWILYASTSPYILETLASSSTELPPEGKRPVTARERGIADLIVLLNPAFEASRYEAVHEAAKHYRPERYELPLLVSVTSEADDATGLAFPAARYVGSIMEHPTSSDLASRAMLNTHGHLSHYLTHRLTLQPASGEAAAENGGCLDDQGQKTSASALRERFFTSLNGNAGPTAGWTRRMCGGLVLTHLRDSQLSPYSIVWNIQTTREIIPDHNDITRPALSSFIRDLYRDISNIASVQTVADSARDE